MSVHTLGLASVAPSTSGVDASGFSRRYSAIWLAPGAVTPDTPDYRNRRCATWRTLSYTWDLNKIGTPERECNRIFRTLNSVLSLDTTDKPVMSAGTCKMTGPDISVVVPTYYRNDLLRDALESITEQTVTPTQAVVVDDSGEAHAESVVAEFDDVRYIPLDRNRGQNAALNIGIRETDGEYVQLLDDDDYLKPTKLARQRSLLERRPEVGVAYCGVEWTDGRIDRPDPDARGTVLSRALAFEM